MMEEIIFSMKQVTGINRRGFQLKDINFELPKGYLMGLIGPNGAGKTTFFDYIMNPKKRYMGSILLEGQELHKDHIQALDKIGFISEANEFMNYRTAKENAEMLGRFYSNFDMETFFQTMELEKLSSSKNVGKMSRGEHMKFQVAFAVAHFPSLLLFDEATAGMDPVFRVDFYKLLHRILQNETCSIILSTHIEEEIHKHMDYVGVLECGKIISFHENDFF